MNELFMENEVKIIYDPKVQPLWVWGFKGIG